MATLTDIKNARDKYLAAESARKNCELGSEAWCEAADDFMYARHALLLTARTFTAENAPAYRAADMDRPYAVALGDGEKFSARIRGEVIDLLLSLNCDEE